MRIYSWPIERLEHAQGVAAALTAQNQAGRQALGMYRQKYRARPTGGRVTLFAEPICLLETSQWLKERGK